MTRDELFRRKPYLQCAAHSQKTGQRCMAIRTKGSKYRHLCWAHEPALEQKRVAARIKGGKVKTREARERALMRKRAEKLLKEVGPDLFVTEVPCPTCSGHGTVTQSSGGGSYAEAVPPPAGQKGPTS